MKFAFWIDGEPVAKGSRTTGVRKDGSRYTRESSERVKPWMTSASQQLFAQANDRRRYRFGDKAVALTVEFLCRRPVNPTHAHPSRGDLDKMVRAVSDALVQAGVLADDRHIIVVHASKRYTMGDPGVSGTVTLAEVEHTFTITANLEAAA